MIQIAPSLLSADFANLQRDVEMLNASEAAMLHLDVMDGVFVPNISFGFPVMKAISAYARKPLDAHLMIVDPQRYISQVRDCGCAIMTVHAEACTHLHRVIQQIRDAGMKASVALNPATPLVMIEEVIADLDMVLLMSVNPGFGGQKFIPESLDKIRNIRRMIREQGLTVDIQVDGGIYLSNVSEVLDAGANVIVAGSAVFHGDPGKNTKDFMEILRRYE